MIWSFKINADEDGVLTTHTGIFSAKDWLEATTKVVSEYFNSEEICSIEIEPFDELILLSEDTVNRIKSNVI